MSAYIYIEGGARGADSKYLYIRCQEAFHKLLDRMGFADETFGNSNGELGMLAGV